jgi:hypothetical protein
MSIAERTQTIDQAGRIAVSDEARAELGLGAGTRLTELVVDGMLVHVPPEVALERALELDLERALAAFHRQLNERGITADDIIAEIERSKDATFVALYPDLASE